MAAGSYKKRTELVPLDKHNGATSSTASDTAYHARYGLVDDGILLLKALVSRISSCSWNDDETPNDTIKGEKKKLSGRQSKTTRMKEQREPMTIVTPVRTPISNSSAQQRDMIICAPLPSTQCKDQQNAIPLPPKIHRFLRPESSVCVNHSRSLDFLFETTN